MTHVLSATIIAIVLIGGSWSTISFQAPSSNHPVAENSDGTPSNAAGSWDVPPAPLGDQGTESWRFLSGPLAPGTDIWMPFSLTEGRTIGNISVTWTNLTPSKAGWWVEGNILDETVSVVDRGGGGRSADAPLVLVESGGRELLRGPSMRPLYEQVEPPTTEMVWSASTNLSQGYLLVGTSGTGAEIAIETEGVQIQRHQNGTVNMTFDTVMIEFLKSFNEGDMDPLAHAMVGTASGTYVGHIEVDIQHPSNQVHLMTFGSAPYMRASWSGDGCTSVDPLGTGFFATALPVGAVNLTLAIPQQVGGYSAPKGIFMSANQYPVAGQRHVVFCF